VIGDRWSLLIVRELSLRDCRYTDLRDGLPGIASNLLAERIRRLTNDGLVERHEPDAAEVSVVYRLTARGRELLPALHAIVLWASPMMVSGPAPDDRQRGRWTAFAAEAFLDRPAAGREPLRLQVDDEHEPVVIDITPDEVTASLGSTDDADVHISGSTWHQLGLLSGELTFADASRLLDIRGTRSDVQRLRHILEMRRTSTTSDHE